MNALIKIDKNKSDLAAYLHACLFSPCPSTLQKAIFEKSKYANGNIPTRITIFHSLNLKVQTFFRLRYHIFRKVWPMEI